MTNVYVMKNRLIYSHGNAFNRGGNNANQVTNRLTKCRQSFYGLGNVGMLTQELLLMFKRIFIHAYINPR